MKSDRHFLQVVATATGKSMVTMPGQVLGRSAIPGGVLVKDRRGSRLVERTRRTATAGDIFSTTTLKNANAYFSAADIAPATEEEYRQSISTI